MQEMYDLAISIHAKNAKMKTTMLNLRWTSKLYTEILMGQVRLQHAYICTQLRRCRKKCKIANEFQEELPSKRPSISKTTWVIGPRPVTAPDGSVIMLWASVFRRLSRESKRGRRALLRSNVDILIPSIFFRLNYKQHPLAFVFTLCR